MKEKFLKSVTFCVVILTAADGIFSFCSAMIAVIIIRIIITIIITKVRVNSRMLCDRLPVNLAK